MFVPHSNLRCEVDGRKNDRKRRGKKEKDSNLRCEVDGRKNDRKRRRKKEKEKS